MDAPILRAGAGGTAGKERTADPTGSPCRPVAWARMDGRSAPAARLVAMPGAGRTVPAKDGMEEVKIYGRENHKFHRLACLAGCAGKAGRGRCGDYLSDGKLYSHDRQRKGNSSARHF